MKLSLVETGWYFITYGTRRERMMCYKQVSLQRPFHIWWSSVLESIGLPFEGGICGGLPCRPGLTGHRRTDELPSPLPKSRADSLHVGGEQIRGAGAAEPCAGSCPGTASPRWEAGRDVHLPVFSLGSWVGWCLSSFP